jgi:RNA-splicing ligase RtcB
MFQDFSSLHIPRLDTLEKEMRRLTEENVKTDVEIGELQGQIRTQINPNIAEVRRGLELTNQQLEAKLINERELLANRFKQCSEDLEDKFKELEVDITGSIDKHVESIKTNFAHELKQKLIVHRRNMIEAVETKCFDIDKDLDHIKLAL